MATATKTKRPPAAKKPNRFTVRFVQLKKVIDGDASNTKRRTINRITKMLPDLNVGQVLSLIGTVQEMREANQ